MNELIYYVDEKDNPTGETAPKLEAHTANTRLHAAFSCYIFNNAGEFLVTRRAKNKKVWPGVWTNSVCGHPAPGESRQAAIIRRTQYELGMTIKDLQVILPKYIYKTPPFNGIIEHEYCPVFFAHSSSLPDPNIEEVDAYKWLKWEDYVHQVQNDTDDVWSWWCKDQLKQINSKLESTKLKSYILHE